MESLTSSPMSQTVKKLIVDNKVMMFSKLTCPFCIQAKALLWMKGVDYHVVNMDFTKNGAEMHKELKKLSKHNTVPCVYVNQQMVGGCDDL